MQKNLPLKVNYTADEISGIFPDIVPASLLNDEYSFFPGFCDVHVHFRQPGFSYKETILTGSKAAAHGGYTAVCTMPNLNPVPDSAEHLKEQMDIIKKDAVINVMPYGAITVGQMGEKLSDMEEMAKDVIAFSDDGRGVQSADMMLEAMRISKSLDKIIVAHCEDNSLLKGGYIHDGVYAREHGHRGICSESEWKPIQRDIELSAKSGCAYHVCHISCKESVELIRQAKKSGVDITCETAPHYLVLDENDLLEDGRFKMNPPLRSREDKEALIEGVIDGTIDMISTDHAPHSAEEKSTSDILGLNDRGRQKLAMDWYIPAGTLLDCDGVNEDGTYINPKYQEVTHYGGYPFPNNGGSNSGVGRQADFWNVAKGISDASFLKVKNITLGYTFEKNFLNKFGCKHLRLYATVTNPFVITSYKGFDPEWAGAGVKQDGPSTINYQVGASIKF